MDTAGPNPEARRVRNAKIEFPRDWAACVAWCRERNLTPICDNAVDSIILHSLRSWLDLSSSYRAVVSQIPVERISDLARRVGRDPSIVWVSCGTSLGLVLTQSNVSPRIPSERIVGVAGASCFNSGYAGLTLYRWQDGKLDEKLIKFCGGEIVSLQMLPGSTQHP